MHQKLKPIAIASEAFLVVHNILITIMLRRVNSVLFAQRIFHIKIQRNLSKAAVLSIQFQPATITFDGARTIYQPERRWYSAKAGTEEEPEKALKPDNFGHLDVRVGKIIKVETDPRAIKAMRFLRVDIGTETRFIGTKLAIADELVNKHVIVLCNAKSTEVLDYKLQGVLLSANDGDEKELLIPPAGAIPGDLVHCEGYDRRPTQAKDSGFRLLNSLKPRLRTNGNLIACVGDVPLEIPGKGPITVDSLKDTYIII